MIFISSVSSIERIIRVPVVQVVWRTQTIFVPRAPLAQTFSFRLYHLHAGFPALEVPEGLILSWGTADPLG